jgi:hypothetical protein
MWCKSVVIVCLCGIAIIVAVAGCETDAVKPEKTPGVQANPYEWLGETHNLCLASSTRRIASEPERYWTVEEIWQMTRLFVESLPETLGQYAAVSPYLLDQYDLGELGNLVKGVIENGASLGVYLDSLETFGVISGRFRLLADDILLAVEHSDRVSLRSATTDIEVAELGEQERALLFAIVSIGQHSLDYWAVALGEELRPAMHPIALADVAGGIWGGVAGWYTRRGDCHWTDVVGGALIGAGTASTLGAIGSGWVR